MWLDSGQQQVAGARAGELAAGRWLDRDQQQRCLWGPAQTRPGPVLVCYYCAHLSLTLNTQHTAGSPAHLPINIKLYTFSNPGSNVAEYRLSWCGWSQSSCLRLGNNGHNCSTRPATSFRPQHSGHIQPSSSLQPCQYNIATYTHYTLCLMILPLHR